MLILYMLIDMIILHHWKKLVEHLIGLLDMAMLIIGEQVNGLLNKFIKL